MRLPRTLSSHVLGGHTECHERLVLTLEEKLERVRAALAELEAREGRGLRVEPATEAELAAVERRFSIALPDEYRTFVTRVARGLTHPDVWSFDECRWGGRDPISWHDSGLRLDAQFYFAAGADPDAQPDAPDQGALPIAYWGCQYYDYLVVTGPEHGQVWSGEIPDWLEPVIFESGPATFLDYVMWRLTNALAGRDTFSQLPGR